MGCGKSTHGNKLAALYRKRFIDLDQYIQKRENKTVQFIFDHEGEEVFRQMEMRYLQELIALPQMTVISLGGGTVCFHNNLELVKSNGVLVYIEMPPNELAIRLRKSRQSRPLLKNVESKDLPAFIEHKLAERNKYYRSAHIIVDGTDLNHLQLKKKIGELIERHS